MNKNFSLSIGTLASIVIATNVFGYEVVNHSDMSDAAFRLWFRQEPPLITSTGLTGKLFRLGLKQVAELNLPNETTYPKSGPSTASCAFPLANYTMLNLVRYGSCFEDNAELGGYRPFAHFYDPQHNGRGLTLGTQVGPSSPDWALKSETTGALTGTNHLSYATARQAFFTALTRRETGFTAEQNIQLRREDWGTTFQALGHVIHHLQDMAQPQHVRNDQHCDGTTAPCGPINNTSGYEKYWQSRTDVIQALAARATTPVLFGLPREFWSMQGDSVAGHISANQGLAAYTSTNFLSAGTDFTIERMGTTRTPMPAYDFAYPRPASTPIDVNVSELFASAPAATVETIRTVVCAGDFANCKMRFYGSEVDPAARKSAVSTFSQEYLGGNATPTRGRAGFFSQNYWTYADAASKLIPKAVEYSAGLIHYFFRGEMEISLPEEGVYGIVDHAVEKTKGTDGFRLIKMKVKNTTPSIAMGAARADGTMIIPQHMGNGQFLAVAKFHRNNCYTPDLRGQIGTVGRGANVIVNDFATCRSATEEIVVSAPAVDVQGSVSTLAAGETRVMSFDFSASPIPIEATDLYLQVVFKGTLGEEVGAVAVTTRNVSEPSFLSNLDSSDIQPCATNEPNICRTITAATGTVDFTACDPNGGGARPCAGRGYNSSGRERHLGFNPDLPNARVVEWYGSKTFSNGQLYYQRDPNSFYRVAVIGEVERAARDITWSLGDGTASKRIEQGDVPVVFGQFRQLTGPGATYVPTEAQLTPAYSRFPATRVKATIDDTAPALSSLPQYAVVRGVVVGVDQTRSEDKDALPFLFSSLGENIGTDDWYVETLHPSNRTVYDLCPVCSRICHGCSPFSAALVQ